MSLAKKGSPLFTLGTELVFPDMVNELQRVIIIFPFPFCPLGSNSVWLNKLIGKYLGNTEEENISPSEEIYNLHAASGWGGTTACRSRLVVGQNAGRRAKVGEILRMNGWHILPRCTVSRGYT